MNKVIISVVILSIPVLISAQVRSSSKITSVKLFQNQAEITRELTVDLETGTNTIVIEKLPPSLYEWSVRAQLSPQGSSQIVSVETVNKPLVTRRQKNIEQIENKIAELRETDFTYADEIKNIHSQLKFLDTLGEYTTEGARRELSGAGVQPRNWEAALEFTARKRSELQREQRAIEKRREVLGKEIQKWEYNLSKIAGDEYVQYYNNLNDFAYINRSSAEVQKFSKMNSQYAQRQRLIAAPRPGIDYEKNVTITLYSGEKRQAKMTLRYMIPGTAWGMVYDLRADESGKKIQLNVQARVTQKTGEDWDSVLLELSTGAPSNRISPPVFYPWYLDVVEGYSGSGYERAQMPMAAEAKAAVEMDEAIAAPVPQAQIKQSGLNINVSLPARISLASGETQKKTIRDYSLDGRQLNYEAFPDLSQLVYLRTDVVNVTQLPWLSGESQIFYEGEYNGKMTLPETLPGAKAAVVLGTAQDMTVKKIMVKKYDDTSGLFGSKLRRKYEYRITAHNAGSDTRSLVIYDRIPVSRNKKIAVELDSLTREFDARTETESEKFDQGRRSWHLSINAGQKIEIAYTLTVTWENGVQVSGIE